jgi:hypothetical protein
LNHNNVKNKEENSKLVPVKIFGNRIVGQVGRSFDCRELGLLCWLDIHLSVFFDQIERIELHQIWCFLIVLWVVIKKFSEK